LEIKKKVLPLHPVLERVFRNGGTNKEFFDNLEEEKIANNKKTSHKQIFLIFFRD
jgi:hypothetical protein